MGDTPPGRYSGVMPHKHSPHRVVRFRSLFTTPALACVLMLSGLPGLTGCSLFALSDEQLQALGDEQAPKFRSEMGGELSSSEINAYVAQVGNRLAAVSEMPDVPWDFTVLDTDTINAFALPGGHVFITRGLMSQLKNEAELAGVLGHEIGHVTARHTGERLEKALTAQFGIQLLAVGLSVNDDTQQYAQISAYAASIGTQLALMAYGRDDEREADRLGVQYMTQLGYNPVGQIGVMEVLASMSKGDDGPQFLKTHPNPEERITLLDDYIVKNYPDFKDDSAYRFYPERYRDRALTPLSRLAPASAGPLEIPRDAVGVLVSQTGACRDHQVH